MAPAPAMTSELETAIRQVVSDAVAAGGVIDIYAAAGLERPDISIIDDDFARRAATNPHPNVADRDAQAAAGQRAQERRQSATSSPSASSRRCWSAPCGPTPTARWTQPRSSRSWSSWPRRCARNTTAALRSGLRDDELAFYDAVCQNDSAVLELGDDTLKTIAQELGRDRAS